MENRTFSDSVKFEVVKKNLECNNGEIHCETCGRKLASISDCHFDHIVPYAKGGKSTKYNCQILCSQCNLRKNDKELRDFVLEEKAKRFLYGESDTLGQQETGVTQSTNPHIEMTKERFDQMIRDYLNKAGNIHKVDFSRDYNNLPSIYYVQQYNGDLNHLKIAFGVEDASLNWNRERIRIALDEFIKRTGDIKQIDLTRKNELPSLPCIFRYYPEYRSFSEIKTKMLDLKVRIRWSIKSAIEAGQKYVKANGKITQKCLNATNGLPSNRAIERLFGSLADFQKAVGSEVTNCNLYISREEICAAVDAYFGEHERVIETKEGFFREFPYSPSTISKRYGLFEDFCRAQKIRVLHTKKARYTKTEVDEKISQWIVNGVRFLRQKNYLN